MILKTRKSPLTKVKKTKLNFENVKYVISTGGSYYIARARGRNVEYTASWFYKYYLDFFDGYDEKTFCGGECKLSYLLNDDEFINFLQENCYITKTYKEEVLFLNKQFYDDPITEKPNI